MTSITASCSGYKSIYEGGGGEGPYIVHIYFFQDFPLALQKWKKKKKQNQNAKM